MRIENLQSGRQGTRARVAATVLWEDNDRPTQEICFETADAFAEDLSCNPHAFLAGCLMPAMRHGEKRIAIDEEICPEFRNGLLVAMGLMHQWYGLHGEPVRIEAKKGVRPPLQGQSRRVCSFLSGGVDSLTLLRTNRLDFPLDHPNSIQDCLFVYGFDIGASQNCDPEIEIYERALDSISAVARDAGITPVPVFTNLRHLDSDIRFWMYQFHGAALASVAHAFSRRFAKAYIASTNTIAVLQPWGSHPLLDPNYSSTDLQIRHEGIRFSRLDKVRLLAEWDVALQHLRVCTACHPGTLNCGKCEKCVRTMLELLAVGRLQMASAFPTNDVTRESLEDALREIDLKDYKSEYRELIDPLAAQGRLDLAEVFRKKFARLDETDWKGAVKRLDRRYLGHSVYTAYKTIRSRTRHQP